MKPFIDYQIDNLPVSNLPYAFKRRLILLTALDDARKLNIVCPEMKTFGHRRRKCFDNIYITDDQHVHDVAINESMFHLYFFFNFSLMNHFHDGPLTIDPQWHTAFLVNDIIGSNKNVFVKHTLILYLKYGESYDQVMPFITGSYSRLILYGQFTWTQVEHLIHDKVEKVRIMGKIDVKPSDYDAVVEFVLRFCRGFDYKFSFHDECFSSSLMEKLKKATENHETHSLVDRGNQLQHFIHKKSIFYFKLDCSLCIFVIFCLMLLNIYIRMAVHERENSATSVTAVLLCLTLALFYRFSLFNYVENVLPRDVRLHLKLLE